MKKKIFIATAAGLSLVLLSASTSDTPTDTATSMKVDDWLVVGSPETFTPGQGSLLLGTPGGNSNFTTGRFSLTVGGGHGGGAQGSYSTTLGYASITTPNAASSLAVGYGATALGYASVALGVGSQSAGYGSFASGYGVIAYGAVTTAVGINNDVGTATQYDEWIHPDGHVFVVGNGGWEDRSNALVTKHSGETTLTNKHWNHADPLADATDDPYGEGEALIVEGHTVLKGNVIIAEAQGDISMGAFGQP